VVGKRDGQVAVWSGAGVDPASALPDIVVANVEWVSVVPGGGSDHVTINDLCGIGVAGLSVNLGLGDNSASNTLVVTGGPSQDILTVEAASVGGDQGEQMVVVTGASGETNGKSISRAPAPTETAWRSGVWLETTASPSRLAPMVSACRTSSPRRWMAARAPTHSRPFTAT